MKGTNQFGIWLKTALLESGMTQKDLAKIVGSTEASISRWVNGEIEPRASKMMKIMDLFGVYDGMSSIINPETEKASRSIKLCQLLFYMTEGETIQICDGHDGWDKFTEFSATSKLLEPFKDRRIICMGAEEAKDGCAIRVEIAEQGE